MEKVTAIRDFFVAGNAHELEHAYRKLGEHIDADMPAVTDWQDVEFIFNRLFVGPAALEAPPFASVYLDAESLVMGKTTLDVRQMYSALGLESPWKNSVPDDHISLELDAVLALKHIAGHDEEIAVQELDKQFFGHLEAWVPRFTQRILDASSGHPAITFVATCLSTWLDDQRKLMEEKI